MDGTAAPPGLPSPGGARLLVSTAELQQAVLLLAQYFPDNVLDIEKAAFGEASRASVVGCVDAAGELRSVGVLQERALPAFGLRAREIVWFGSRDKGLGWGTRLFEDVLQSAREDKVDAVMSSSTNAALPFWLSRRGVRIASSVLRAKKRGPSAAAEAAGFRVAHSPDSAMMERLYSERVVRNRKGRVVGDFEGKPYYYCVAHSNHVWYLLNPKLSIKSRVNKGPPRLCRPSADPACADAAAAATAAATAAAGDNASAAATSA